MTHQNKVVMDTPKIQAFYVDSERPTEQFPGLRVAQDVDWELLSGYSYYHTYYSYYYYYYYYDIVSAVISRKIAVIHLGDHVETDWIASSFIWDVMSSSGYGDQDTNFPKDAIKMEYYDFTKEEVDAWIYSDVAALIGGSAESCAFTAPSAVSRLTVNTSLGNDIIAFHGESSRRRSSKVSPDSYRVGKPVNTLIIYMETGQPEGLTGAEPTKTVQLDLDLDIERFEWNQLEGVAL